MAFSGKAEQINLSAFLNTGTVLASAAASSQHCTFVSELGYLAALQIRAAQS